MKSRGLRERLGATLACAPGAPVLAAVSGGADSVALLILLVGHPNLRVEAAHCNFHLRGEESDRDEDFVRELCSRLGVRLHVRHFNASATAAERKISVEMACRDLRYEWFFSLMAERGFRRVAVAHNADDNIETMLLNLIRGTGITGMAGIQADTGRVWRPLLDISRTEIEEFLKEEGETFVTDSSNLATDFNRNFIRHRLLPLIEERWPSARRSLALTRRNMQRAAAVSRAAMAAALANPEFLPRDKVKEFADPPTLVHEFIVPYGASARQEEEILRALLSDTPAGPHWILGNLTARLSREGLHIEEIRQFSEPEAEWEHITGMPESGLYDNQGRSGYCLLPSGESEYYWRAPKPAERMRLRGINGTALISKILKDAKVGAGRRPIMPLLCRRDTGEAVWIPGIKRSAVDNISRETTSFYRVTLKTNQSE